MTDAAGSSEISLDVRISGDDLGVTVQVFHAGKPISPRFAATYETLGDRDLRNPTGDARQVLNELVQLASQYVASEFVRKSFEQ